MHKKICCVCHTKFRARRVDKITCSDTCRKKLSRIIDKCDKTMPQKKYNIIYADPNIHFNTYSRKGDGKSPQRQYDCLGVEAIKKMPVERLAADDCVLCMWVYGPFARQAPEIAEAWGFTVSSLEGFAWVKTTNDGSRVRMGTGYTTRKCQETMLFAKIGKPKRASASIAQVVHHPRMPNHSEKPPIFRDRIVELWGRKPRIELFARHTAPGWDAWGNEVGKLDTPTKGIGEKHIIIPRHMRPTDRALEVVNGASIDRVNGCYRLNGQRIDAKELIRRANEQLEQTGQSLIDYPMTR